MKSLSAFFSWVWGAVAAAISKVSVVVASIGTAVASVVAYLSSVLAGLANLAQKVTQFADEISVALGPVREQFQENSFLCLLSYSINLDYLLGTIGIFITAVCAIVGLILTFTVGYLLIYVGFVILSYALRVLKGATASFIDFN